MRLENFKHQVGRAIKRVMQSLPDKRVDREKVVAWALGVLVMEEYDQKQAERIIRRLIALTPHCHGVKRRKGYWRLVLRFLSREEALRCYLGKFPRSLTRKQKDSLRDYLIIEMGFLELSVERGLAEFSTRQNTVLAGDFLN